MVKLTGVLLLSFSLWGKILLRGPSWCLAPLAGRGMGNTGKMLPPFFYVAILGFSLCTIAAAASLEFRAFPEQCVSL